jgi:DNA-binding transcriptional LysR family regulator
MAARAMGANYQHLRAFHAIATDGGVSRAARRVNVSQPTLSQQLKALEERHGVSLFESRRVPLTLTAAGRELFAMTTKLFAIASDIGDLLGATTGVDAGMLRLGADNPYYAAKIVSMLHQRHPQTHVQVRMGNGSEVMRWLGDAHVDAALASEPPADGAFSYEPLGCDQLMCGLPVGHALAMLDVVPLQAFSTETLLLREPTSKTRAFMERALADFSVEPSAVLELQSRETIREGIALGLGLGVFYDKECPPDARIVYRPIDTAERDYHLRSYLVCQSQRRRDALMRLLKSIVEEIHGSAPVADAPGPELARSDAEGRSIIASANAVPTSAARLPREPAVA